MSKYKILAITMAAVMTSALAACGRTENSNEISPIVQTTSAETVTENTSVTSETAAETASDESNELDEQTAETLRREFAEYINETDPLYAHYDPSNVIIEKYYGRYSGCEVFLSMYSGGEDALDYYSVAGYGMIFPCLGYSIYVHKDGNIYELDEAYEKGYISEKDVAEIAEIQNGIPPEKKDPSEANSLGGEDRKAEKLRREKNNKLRRKFAEYISETDPVYRDIDPSSIKFEQYYGTYNGCEVFLPLYKSGYDEAEDRFTIAGYKMYFPCLGYEIYVYKDGEFYELEDAYEKGHIGEDVVAAIAEDNHARYFYAFE